VDRSDLNPYCGLQPPGLPIERIDCAKKSPGACWPWPKQTGMRTMLAKRWPGNNSGFHMPSGVFRWASIPQEQRHSVDSLPKNWGASQGCLYS